MTCALELYHVAKHRERDSDRRLSFSSSFAFNAKGGEETAAWPGFSLGPGPRLGKMLLPDHGQLANKLDGRGTPRGLISSLLLACKVAAVGGRRLSMRRDVVSLHVDGAGLR